MGKIRKKEEIEYVGETPDFIKMLKEQTGPKERKPRERDLDQVLQEDEQPQVVVEQQDNNIPKLKAKIEKVVVKKQQLTKKQIQKLKNKNLVSFD